MPRSSQYPLEMLVAAKRAGYTVDEIARALGLSRTAVGRRLTEIGEGQPARPELQVDTWYEIIRDWASGVAAYADDQHLKQLERVRRESQT